MLAYASEKPLCGVPSLEALAWSARDHSLPVYAVISVGVGDAVYAARYNVKNDEMSRVGDYFIGDIKGLAALITEPCVLVGTGAASYTEKITGESGIKIKAIEANPGGAAVAFLAARRLARGESDDALSLTPLYLKESTAKVFVNKYKP
jgi:tRNA threonylcarbamoyladenosine biosynthesis protein TsaB